MRLVAVAGGVGMDADNMLIASVSNNPSTHGNPVGGSSSGHGVVKMRDRREIIDEDLELLAVATSSGVVPTPTQPTSSSSVPTSTSSSSSAAVSSSSTSTSSSSSAGVSTAPKAAWQIAKDELRGQCVQIIRHACALLSAGKELLGIGKHQQATTQIIFKARKRAMVSLYTCCSTFFHGLETLSLGSNEGVVGACVSSSLKTELRRLFGSIEQHFFRLNNNHNNTATSRTVGSNNLGSIRGSENSRQVTEADVNLDQLGNNVETFPLNKKQRACMKSICQLTMN